MGQVVTELVIDSDTSGADKFTQAMDGAAASAQKGVSSAAATSLAVAGVGAAALAAVVGLRSFIDYVGAQSQALVDIASHAAIAGISLKEFQQTLFAAMASGVSEKDFVSGLDRISADLTAATRGATEFGKVFEQNGLSIKNANGELKTANQAVADLAGLMQKATPAQQQALASIVGISKSWVPFLAQGVDGIEAQKKAALDLGIIIDDSTIAKAKEFSNQWHTAIAGWDLQLKASLASILPLMIQLANIATQVINGIGSFTTDLTRLFTPVDQMNVPQLDAQLNSLYKFRDTLEELQKTNQNQGVSEGILEKMLGLPPGSSLSDVDAAISHVASRIDELKSRTRIAIDGGSGINLPSTGGEGRDALETEIERLEKHIAVTKADVEAVDQSAAAQAGLRAEATLYAAAERAGKTDLEKYAQQFLDLREKIEAATQELNKAKIASDIKFARDTAFLSPQDVQIAQQLRKIYGDDVPAAMASTEAAAMRINNAIKDARDTGLEFSKSFVQGLLQGKSGMEALTAAAGQLASKLADKALTDLFSGNVLQAGVEAVAAIGAQIFANHGKEEKALDEARQAWAKMADQVVAFNRAAAGFDLGPLTQQIQQLSATESELMAAAEKAKDNAGAAQIANTFNAGVTRIVNEFKEGTAVLSPMAQQIKGVNDEYHGLYDTLKSLHLDSLTIGLYEAAAAKIKNIVDQFVQQAGADLVKTYQTEITTARQDLVSAYQSEQSAISGTISRMQSYVSSLKSFQQSLLLGPSSTLSPADRLATAKTSFDVIAGKAKAGDETAIGQLQDASTSYLDQAKNFYGSTEKYAAIFADVQTALNQAQAGAKSQVDVATRQLDALTSQVGLLVDLNAGVKTVASTIAELQKINALGVQISVTYGLDISTSVADGASRIVDAVNKLKQTRDDAAAATNAGPATITTSPAPSFSPPTPFGGARAPFGIPAFAGGGSFDVGGVGGTDSRLVQFMASPNERVTVQTPAQRLGSNDNTAGLGRIASISTVGFNAVVSELRGLRDENAALRAELAGMRGEMRRGNAQPRTPGKAA